MGGNAIQNARRISKLEFDAIINELHEILPELNFKPVKAYKSKEDFGDIDLVLATSPNVDLKQLIRDRLHPIDEYNNGPFFSVDYKGVQVDFIFMAPEHVESALNYFHWNDLGNFIGRVARSLNFKYGHDGLVYEKHFSDHYKISIPVSTDTKKVLEFLGYDYDKWVEGFDEKDEIFAYAMATPYFNATYFSLEEQAHNDRVRNRKRKMYQSMLAYITDTGIAPRPKLTPEQRQEHFDRACQIFGNDLAERVATEQLKYDLNVKVKELFNGDIVSAMTGLSGKALGGFLQLVKSTEPNLNVRILDGGEVFVRELILKHLGDK